VVSGLEQEEKKRNGTQLADKHEQQFLDWTKRVSNAELIEMINLRDGKLKRTAVATACGFDRANLGDKKRPGIALLAFEEELRGTDRKILPRLAEAGIKAQKQPKSVDKSVIKRAGEESQVPKLQQEILELKSELAALRGKLGRFSELAEIHDDMAEL
jgi:hypothetical protein